MKILEIQTLSGPNYWSINHKLIVIKLDIRPFEDLPSYRIKGFTDRLISLLPGLYEHQCSKGRPGGFIERLRTGTWMGHIVEHIAIELQVMAGMDCTFGKTTYAGPETVYDVAFQYIEEKAGEYAAAAGVRIAEAMAAGIAYNADRDVEELRNIYYNQKPGPSTSSIVEAAKRKNIPVLRLDKNSLTQLGYGVAQKRIEATISEHTSSIAVDLASDKQRTKDILEEAGIPVPSGIVAGDTEEFINAVDSIGFPLAIKPNNGNQGKGVSLNINNHEEAWVAYEKAGATSEKVIVERFCRGNDYRLLVINNTFMAASLRTPASVTGDGRSTIRRLIEITNSDPLRGESHEKILTRIKTDWATEDFLRTQGLTLDDVPAFGREIFLRKTANLSTGGTAEDVTDLVHADVKAMAIRVAKTIGLDICGIDYIAENISVPVSIGHGYVLEVNAAPGFRMHTHPYKGKPRPVGEAVVEMLFPGNSEGRIPIVAVTGTNGKTTTTRLIAHIAKNAGFVTGFTTTEGIYIGGQLIEKGDCTGPVSAAKVLRDRCVEFAVLECARGGILRSGLAFDMCDTGVVTNVAEDHLGLKGINSLEDMARVKSIVAESVRKSGMAVLNANDESTYGMRERVKSTVGLFSIDDKSRRVVQHCSNGGTGALYSNGKLSIIKGDNEEFNISAEDIPITFGGRAPFMIENILAAMLAAWSRGINSEIITKALMCFSPSYENTPGRMNLYKFPDFEFLLDYAHNFHGISALGQFIRQSNARPKVGIISTAGDRRDIDLFNVGKVSAGLFDEIIIRVDENTRGRKESEIIELIYSGVVDRNKNYPVQVIKDETEAVYYAVRNALPGSLIVLFAYNIAKVDAILTELMDIQTSSLVNITR
ncbi:MAG TPA: cyanophycin synthetase [Bacteroidales bacterium]|nr:cyanophycin synthetase [Bacteroidales bacterium]